MKFEKALPLMRKGTYMTREGDPRRVRVRVAELDGETVFVARVGKAGPHVIGITATEVFAEDWEEFDLVIQRDKEQTASTVRPAEGGAQ
ncbi:MULTISPECIES: hypothetical protein [Marivita]|uniref:Uncharacterized protein n=1 Tax=Marivita cryptomonadis TaxID=505252 RepID=A0A9Q2S0N6_9RHOB|nr:MULTISPECIES: hypothetical protein [Marivita]MCR9170067.1 hypothetical protein [Paracoccaceae bacterium]MBM2322668.1 hypothetical protein [Marivita cryptomonadis]MBM2332250.1 hypothetical protein [Marivita cryptomonadis]MBM2341834.1 hypothetical protein [Marivita cryptomonadis]MBM2346498.1 hypothetical protein [Marivita cryptomonadis]